MEFIFTEEQEMMTETLTGFLADHCTPQHLRDMAAAGHHSDPARMAALRDLGLVGALVPEAHGGLGLAGPDIIGMAQACGAALLPEPLIDTIAITLPALVALEQFDLISDVLSGTSHVALTHPNSGLVPAADQATHLLALSTEQITLSQAPKSTLQPSVDPVRQVFSAEPSAEGTTLATGEKAARICAAAYDAGALYTAAQLLGIAQKSIDISVAYATDRTQFGRAIGANQAIKHHLASAQVAVEFARPVLHAASALPPGAGPLSAARISHAKIACGKAAETATKTAVQVHGGMGYSEEVDVHFFLKRALCLRHSWGTETDHRNRYAARLTSQPFDVTHLFPQE